MNMKTWAVAAALLWAGMAQATCYSVYKSDGTILLETSTTPVDLTQPLGDSIPMKFGPGASMTMSEHGFYCQGRTGEMRTSNSLADAVLAEEKKTMLVKGPEVKAEAVKAVALKAEPAKVQVAKEDGAKTVMVKQDGTNAMVETQKGTVLKVKAKAKEAQ
jgi:hypothetical protein